MGCKNCKNKKSIINNTSDNSKIVFVTLGAIFILVPWVMGVEKLFYMVKDFILSLF
jgi:hypothetical protein|tara:strand:- start:213 stop:380 length:168 start_codon:yes stop_codon:yes gene_type:complete